MNLAERVNYLEEENRQLRDALRGSEDARYPAKWNLSPSEKRILRCFMASMDGFRTREALHHAASRRLDTDSRMIDVHVSQMRRKLASYGISIQTVWGHGYKMDAASRQIVTAARIREVA